MAANKKATKAGSLFSSELPSGNAFSINSVAGRLVVSQTRKGKPVTIPIDPSKPVKITVSQ